LNALKQPFRHEQMQGVVLAAIGHHIVAVTASCRDNAVVRRGVRDGIDVRAVVKARRAAEGRVFQFRAASRITWPVRVTRRSLSLFW
jgi:hypothetical protein